MTGYEIAVILAAWGAAVGIGGWLACEIGELIAEWWRRWNS